MRTITKTIQLYKYEELSESAKNTALKNFHNYLYRIGFYWLESIYNSIEKISEAFNIDIKEYSENSFMYLTKDNMLGPTEMNFKRAIAYINNRFNFKKLNYSYKEKIKNIWNNRKKITNIQKKIQCYYCQPTILNIRYQQPLNTIAIT